MSSYTIGLDHTGSGRAALDWVTALPLGQDDVVKVVTVAEFPGGATGSAHRRLFDAAATIRAAHPETRVVEVAADGPVLDRLVAESRGGDFLVIGAHRGRVLQSMLTGWLPERIAVASPIPTVIVPDDWARFDGGGDVVVGVDTDAESSVALAGAHFARALGRAVILLSARPAPVMAQDGPDTWSSEGPEPDTAGILAGIEQQVNDRYPTVSVRTKSVFGEPDETLTRTGSDALVVLVGREHSTAAGGALFGSVGMHLIHSLRTPLCVVPV
jgi:nucleotide-binding universal stress UspA family protein